MLAVFRDLGIKIMQLTYNATNRVGSGYRVPEDHGLTPFGRDVISEMNRLGILIDLSYCGDRTTNEAIRRPKAGRDHLRDPAASPKARTRPRRPCGARRWGGMVGAMAFPSS